MRRASFYSGAPDKISRAIQKCEMLEARMTRRLLSPRQKTSEPGILTALTPRRRIQPTTLFSKLFDPSPCKPKPGGMLSPVQLAKREIAPSRCTNFSSPSKNTRGRMRLFQSPSPKHVSPNAESITAGNQTLQSSPQIQSFMSPIKTATISCFDSPSKNTRFQSRLQLVCQDRVISTNNQTAFQTSITGSSRRQGELGLFQSTPTKMQQLFQSPTNKGSTMRKGLSQHPSKETPNKLQQQANSECCSQGTPTRALVAPCTVRTPRKTPSSMLDFSSPSKNTRSQSKIFQPAIQDSLMLKRGSGCEPEVRVGTTAGSSAPGFTSNVGFLSSMMTSSQGDDVKIFTSAAFTNSSSCQNTSLSASGLVSPRMSSSLLLTPSKNTRSQTRVCLSLSENPLGSSQVQGRDTSSSSGRVPAYTSAVSQRLFSSPAKQASNPLMSISLQNGKELTNGAAILSPSHSKNHLSGTAASIHQRKRKLSFLSSPDRPQNAPSKRHCLSNLNHSNMDNTPMTGAAGLVDYFECDEVFIEGSGKPTTCRELSTSEPQQQPLPNPSVEQLRQQSTGSGVPSPVFPGLEKRCSDQSSYGSPNSPVFEAGTPRRANRETGSEMGTPGGVRAVLGHFVPQLSTGSLSHLVTSPLLSPSKHRRLRRREDGGMSSPDAGLSSSSLSPSFASNRENEPGCGNQCPNKRTPGSGKKSFSRMPTKFRL